MSHTLDELIRPLGAPLGARIPPVRPFTALSPLTSPVQPPAVIRNHGLGMLATGLALIVATLWSVQSGFIVLPGQPKAVIQPHVASPVINACTDPTRGMSPAPAASLREVQDVVLPEIRAGYPPHSGKPEIITLPPDMSSMMPMTPVPTRQQGTVPLPPSKPAAKSKPVAKDNRSGSQT